MNKLILISALAISITGCQSTKTTEIACTSEAFTVIDEHIQSGDSSGHGPDIGSNEWHSVVEYKLDLGDNNLTPERGTKAWCEFIQKKISPH